MSFKTERYILDADGAPQICEDLLAWGEWMSSAARHVALDQDEGPDGLKIRISTVFLGLDHGFSVNGDHPPVLWETMVFGGLLDGEMQRYTSREAALRGHQAMCRRVAASIEYPTRR